MKYIILATLVVILSGCSACTVKDENLQEHEVITSSTINSNVSSNANISSSDHLKNSSANLSTPVIPPPISAPSAETSIDKELDSIIVNVSDVQNNPVNDVKVEVFNSKDELLHMYQTDSNGEFILTDISIGSTYNFSIVMFSVDDKRVIERLSHSIANDSSAINLKLSRADTSLDFYKASNRIDIYVVDEQNLPITDAYVNVNPIESIHPQSTEYQQTNTNKDGRITIINPQMTKYSLEITKGNLKLLDTFDVTQEVTKLIYTLK